MFRRRPSRRLPLSPRRHRRPFPAVVAAVRLPFVRPVAPVAVAAAVPAAAAAPPAAVAGPAAVAAVVVAADVVVVHYRRRRPNREYTCLVINTYRVFFET